MIQETNLFYLRRVNEIPFLSYLGPLRPNYIVITLTIILQKGCPWAIAASRVIT